MFFFLDTLDEFAKFVEKNEATLTSGSQEVATTIACYVGKKNLSERPKCKL